MGIVLDEMLHQERTCLFYSYYVCHNIFDIGKYCQLRKPLKAMFTSTKLANSARANKFEEKLVKKNILHDKTF